MARKSKGSGDDQTLISAGGAMVRLDALRKIIEVITQLGGDAEALLAKFQIDVALFDNRHAVIPYRALVQIMERAAQDLNCPDFGMRLAALQGAAHVPLGPIEVAMRNCATLREAFWYCQEHNQAVSSGSRICVEDDQDEDATCLRFDILVTRLPHSPQAVEHALLLTRHKVDELSGGHVAPREIWFTHDPVSSPETYEEYFGIPVRFGRRLNGIILDAADFDAGIPNCDPQIFEIADNFIIHRFPCAEPDLTTRVRVIVERLLLAGDCAHSGVAATLGMHPRTLQRRLRAEGESFETIKDAVRKDLALYYLKQSAVPLSRLAEMLGYSETSVLSRSCYRWFGVSPRQVRDGDARSAGGDMDEISI